MSNDLGASKRRTAPGREYQSTMVTDSDRGYLDLLCEESRESLRKFEKSRWKRGIKKGSLNVPNSELDSQSQGLTTPEG